MQSIPFKNMRYLPYINKQIIYAYNGENEFHAVAFG
jgi:hypothetical protein